MKVIEHVLTDLQHAEAGSGPWKLYIYGKSGYHTGGVWFRKGTLEYPDEEITFKVAEERAGKAIREGREVRVCDGGDMLVFHSLHGNVVHGGDFWTTA